MKNNFHAWNKNKTALQTYVETLIMFMSGHVVAENVAKNDSVISLAR